MHHAGKGALSSRSHPGRHGVAAGHLLQLHCQLHALQGNESPSSAAGKS